MGRKSEVEIGKRRQVALRNGNENVPNGFGGMYLEGDPGAVPFARIRHGENIRFIGGNISGRQGLDQLTATALHDATACIIGLDDYQTKPRRVYFPFFGCPGVSAAAGFTLTWFDYDQDPIFQRGPYYVTGATSLVIGTFAGKVMIGLDSGLRELTVIVAPYGRESIGISGSQQDFPIATFTGFTVGAITTTDFTGKAFVGLSAGAASAIGTWNGLTALSNDLTGINPVTAFCSWRDVLVAGHAAASNLIRLRTVGGTWSTVAPGAGTVASVKMVSYKDLLYITDDAANVWSYNGTTLAIARTVAGSTMKALTVFNGFLYYGYKTAGNSAVIGRYDGTTWTDSHKDLTAQDANARQPRALVSYRGNLIAAVDTTANGGRIYESPGTSTSGTYVQYNTFTITLNGNVTDAVVL